MKAVADTLGVSRVVVNAGISRSDIRDMMLEALERRFGDCQAPHPVEVLTDSGAPYTAKDKHVSLHGSLVSVPASPP